MKSRILNAALCVGLAACSGSSNKPDPESPDASEDSSMDVSPDSDMGRVDPVSLRVATYNVSLFRPDEGQLEQDLTSPGDTQAEAVAEVIQRVRPDIVLLNEFDYDSAGRALQGFSENYLKVSHNGSDPIDYPHVYVFASNTGVHSGQDLDNNGDVVATPGSRDFGGDAFGYGVFEGQYAFAVLSKYPADEGAIRTFQNFLWKDMPNNLLPVDWYVAAERDVFRLSSKNHVDLPLKVDGRVVHLLASHPTPPSFDGPEDRNGRRNHDEIRFWTDYVEGESYMTDDAGLAGGLSADAQFVVVGDLNLDPTDGDARSEAMTGLLGSDRTQDPNPMSQGGTDAAAQGGANDEHEGDPGLDTADFSDGQVGNLRVDYATPSANVNVTASEVYWPTSSDEHADLAGASDHHMVWVDLELP